MYQFKTTQKLNISINEAWSFLSNPKNLKDITPEYMRFDIISGDDKKMFPGQIIEYILTPVLNIPFKWVTEITHVKQKKYFVDEQRFGPYSFWHHKHFIKEVEDGVIMEDIVHYKLPLGIIGRLAHRLFVRNKVEEIFSFRRKKLDSLFNN
tara:strand:+ start:2253 stop:2705 length:453 start_codon:yes stop_codon:yes gene_type:complete